MISESMSHRELEAMRFTVSEKERSLAVEARTCQFGRRDRATGLTSEAVADPPGFRKCIRVRSGDDQPRFIGTDDRGVFRREKEKAVVEQKLIANRKWREKLLCEKRSAQRHHEHGDGYP